MTTKQTSTKHASILIDIIHCNCCGSRMIANQANYVCPNQNRQAGCPLTSVNAQHLLHQLMSPLINRMMTPENLSCIVASIQQDASNKILAQRDKLDETGSAIEELNHQWTDIMTRVEYGKIPYAEVASQLASIERTRAGLVHESDVSREEIDKLEFVSDQEGIQSSALDVAIYTECAEPKLAKQLAETFIADIRVAATTCTVTYTHPIPDASNNQVITSESFPLP